MKRDIAIIGISGRFPMANNLDELFDNLKSGLDSVRDISPERVRQTALPKGRRYKKIGSIDDIDKFDHAFFGISLAEAKAMCPEQRLILEATHGAIENAGYSPNSLSGSNTAVFVAVANSEYYKHASEFEPTLITGNSSEYLVAKIGRHFNLRGNATSIETSCSSALVAVHSACNELLMGDADLAIAAGSHVALFPFVEKEFGLDLDSPDGKSRAFSEAANGMSYGEVVAAILLKPLDRAVADGDIIHAIIKGSAVNNNGKGSSSITAPDSKAQAEVLKKAWRNASVDPLDLSYIEAHGSGTQLGDSLEFEGLNLAFSDYSSGKLMCPISTIKSNIGHGRKVAGLAGLLKTVLSLKNRVLFPTIHFSQPSQLIDFENSYVYVNTEFVPWNVAADKPRYAGVTSIGASGTNCHVVLQEGFHPVRKVAGSSKDSAPLMYHVMISGKTNAALKRNTEVLLKHITKHTNEDIADISFTLAKGRDHYDFRSSYLVGSTEELALKISEHLTDYKNWSSHAAEKAELIFIFSDSGAISDELVARLASAYPIFNAAWNDCEKILPCDTVSLKDFAFQYSLYTLLAALDLTTSNFISIGIGSLLHPVIDKEMSLFDGLQQAKAFVPEPILNVEERVKKLLTRFGQDRKVVFLDMGINGKMSSALKKSCASLKNLCVKFLDESITECDPFLAVIESLYLRRLDGSVNYSIVCNPLGRTIELPSYQFERTHCWLRESPREEALTKVNKSEKYLLKEESGATETKIAEIFAEALDLYEISVDDNFFDIGGDSLKATKVIAEIKAHYSISLDFEDVFDFPTIRLLSVLVNKQLNTEKRLILIWETVLQAKNLQITDDFFDLGGHSLMATTMIVLINKEFGLKLNFEDIFQNSKIAALAKLIDSYVNNGAKESSIVIPNAPAMHHYNLTYAQKRMWFLNHFDGGNTAYNNISAVIIDGDLNQAIFDQAIRSVVERHESLRTIFRLQGDNSVQVILDMDGLVCRSEVVTIEGDNDLDTAISEILSQEYGYPFDLARFPLFRVRLIKIRDDKHICILNQHHIISDGWSMGVFIEDFYAFYEAQVSGKVSRLSPLKFQIKDYAEWQQTSDFQDVMRKQEKYWLDVFFDPVAQLALPLDRSRPLVQSFAGDHVYFSLNPSQTDALRKIARDSGCTLYMVLIGVYNVLLSRVCNSDDIVVGTPVAGRRFDGLQSLIGLFVNTIVLRNQPLANLSFKRFLSNVKEVVLKAFNNQDYPYEELVKKVLKDRDTSRNPLFDTMLVLQNNRTVVGEFSNLKTTPYPVKSNSSQFDLILEGMESDGGIDFDFGFSTALFESRTIHRLVGYFKNIVDSISGDTEQPIGVIEMIPNQEKNQLLYDFNSTETSYSHQDTIITLFERQVEKTPNNAALHYSGQTICYWELKDKVDKMASYLQGTCGVKAGDLVGILLDRDEYLIPSIFGILKAGAAYVPIDPRYPTERKNSILEDSNVGVLLTRERYWDPGMKMLSGVVYLDQASAVIGSHELVSPIGSPSGSDLAYVIYTSGSTGRPKGVMIEHHSVINRLQWMQKQYPLKHEDVLLQKTPIVFDVSVWELFWWSFTGASLALLEPEEEKSPRAIVEAIVSNKVSQIHFVPAMLGAFLSDLGSDFDYGNLYSLRQVFSSGEALKGDHVSLFGKTIYKHCNTRLINLYGPTEATVDVSYYECDFTSDLLNVPIGKPIDNISLYVLDKHGELLPTGASGELHISGVGVARGYLNNKGLTDEKFIYHQRLGKRMYKTGDLVRWLEDGNIEYLDRIDNQVKLRGFRIELGEIESHLVKHEQITEVAVLAKEREGEKYLIAYYQADQELDVNVLKDFLSRKLPVYMVPSFFLWMNSMPLTANGKIDKKALPAPEIEFNAIHVGPLSDIEKRLVKIWVHILRLKEESIGVHDDFFSLGGHSIMAVRLIYAIETEFFINLTLRQIFENSTIVNQAKLLAATQVEQTDGIARVEKREYYPTSSAQERLYYEQMLNKETITYNVYSAYHIKGDLDLQKLSTSFQTLVDRHDGLRTSFIISGDDVVQRIEDNVDFTLNTINTSITIEEAFSAFVRPFDLAVAPLLRCGLMPYMDGYLLFLDIHHIVCDGFSLNIIMNDFKELYAGKTPDPLALRYVDYAWWQKHPRNILEKQKKYWMDQLSGDIPKIELPILKEKSSVAAYHSVRTVVNIEDALYVKAKKFAVQCNVSDYMFLLSIYFILLSKMTGSKDIIVGSDSIGRIQSSLKSIVGSFVNILPLRLKVSDEMSFADFLQMVRDCVLGGFENQEYQIDQIVSMLKTGGERIVHVHFAFTNFFISEAELSNLAISKFEVDKREATIPYEFKLEVNENYNRFEIYFMYSNELYDSQTMELFMLYYRNILTSVLEDSSVTIGNIALERAPDFVLQE